MSVYEHDDDGAQQRYAENVFVGIGRGSTREEAKEEAFERAWQRAKAGGKAGRPLRVQAEYVSGENPITWYKVVLVDDGA
jgi:hypothetical protein